MNYASIKVLVLVLASGGLIAACATGSDSAVFSGSAGVSGAGGGDSGSGGNGGSGNGGSGNGGNGGSVSGSTVASTGSSPTGGDAGPSCIPMCNADSDCQNTCPVAQTGINCCDTQTGLCYVASTSICPAPPTDGGTVMPPY